MTVQSRPAVAVVGAGFSGVLTALHLLSRAEGPVVRLIERRPQFGRGAAYSTRSSHDLLNVRASNMSAFPDQPNHFVDWLAATGAEDAGRGFTTRARYGAYLQAMLRQATEGTEAGRLILEADGAVGLSPAGEGWTVAMAMGRTFPVDAAVLAVGNLPPHLPPGVDAEAAGSPAYHGDPWSADFRDLRGDGCVVLIGAGLTMVDVALRIARERPDLKMLAISRHGLVSRSHLGDGPAPQAFQPAPGATSLTILRTLRRRASQADWRSVVDGLRPHVQAIWRDWPLVERRRFLRHLRVWWDIHRHRIAPPVASRLDHLTASGTLRIAAGRLVSVGAEDGALRVAWTARGACEPCTVAAAAVVNCTGPNGDLHRIQDPLLADLAGRGLIRPDACRLGLDVDADGRLIGRDGEAAHRLYAVGPITRGAFWEITSVPDIRVQARACAASVLHALRPSAVPA